MKPKSLSQAISKFNRNLDNALLQNRQNIFERWRSIAHPHRGNEGIRFFGKTGKDSPNPADKNGNVGVGKGGRSATSHRN
jgi:hypothetical protein